MPDQAMRGDGKPGRSNPSLDQDVEASPADVRDDDRPAQRGFTRDDPTVEIPAVAPGKEGRSAPRAAGDRAPERDARDDGFFEDDDPTEYGESEWDMSEVEWFDKDGATMAVPVAAPREAGRAGAPVGQADDMALEEEMRDDGFGDDDDATDHGESAWDEFDVTWYDEDESTGPPGVDESRAAAFDPWGTTDESIFDTVPGRTGAFKASGGPGRLRKRRRVVSLSCVGLALPLVIFAGVGFGRSGGEGNPSDAPGPGRPASTSTVERGSLVDDNSPEGSGDNGSARSSAPGSANTSARPSQGSSVSGAPPTNDRSSRSRVAPGPSNSPVPRTPKDPAAPPGVSGVPDAPVNRPAPSITRRAPATTRPVPPATKPAPSATKTAPPATRPVPPVTTPPAPVTTPPAPVPTGAKVGTSAPASHSEA